MNLLKKLKKIGFIKQDILVPTYNTNKTYQRGSINDLIYIKSLVVDDCGNILERIYLRGDIIPQLSYKTIDMKRLNIVKCYRWLINEFLDVYVIINGNEHVIITQKCKVKFSMSSKSLNNDFSLERVINLLSDIEDIRNIRIKTVLL